MMDESLKEDGLHETTLGEYGWHLILSGLWSASAWPIIVLLMYVWAWAGAPVRVSPISQSAEIAAGEPAAPPPPLKRSPQAQKTDQQLYRMYRRPLRWKIGLLPLVAFVFVFAVSDHSAAWSRRAGEAAGGAIALVIISGVLPMIWWATRRFKAERATEPVILWWVVLVLVSGGLHLGGLL